MDQSTERELSQLLSARDKGVFSDSKLAFQFGQLVQSVGLNALIDRVSADLVPLIKQGIALTNHAAADAEYLRPQDSPFHGFFEYYLSVEQALFSDRSFGAPRHLRVICLPSFEPEWAIVLVDSDRAKKYSLVLCKSDSQIWSAGETPVISTRLEWEVPNDLAMELCDLWQMMTFRARFPKFMSSVLDGVSFHFEHGGRSATTWSPEPQTAPGKLVSLCELLYEFIEKNAGRQASVDDSDRIRSSINALRIHCRDRYGAD